MTSKQICLVFALCGGQLNSISSNKRKQGTGSGFSLQTTNTDTISDLYWAVGVQHGQHDELHGWEQVGQAASLPLELQVVQHHEHRLAWPDGRLEATHHNRPTLLGYHNSSNLDYGYYDY